MYPRTACVLLLATSLLSAAAGCDRGDDAPSCAKANERVLQLSLAELEKRVDETSRGAKELVLRNFEKVERRCVEDKWPASVRRCLGAATTIAAAGECSKQLSEELRAKLEAELQLRTFPKQTKEELARIAVLKLSAEAYPQWAMAKPSKMCPDGLAELVEYAEVKGEDPWGRPYRVLCGDKLPAGAKGLAVVSDGPDGKPDTDDDVKSW